MTPEALGITPERTEFGAVTPEAVIVFKAGGTILTGALNAVELEKSAGVVVGELEVVVAGVLEGERLVVVTPKVGVLTLEGSVTALVMAVLEDGVDALEVDKHAWILQSIHMATIRYPFHPQNLTAKHPPLIEYLIELEFSEHHQCVAQIINMIADLKLNGSDSRYLKKMKGPFLELKTASRGGDKGGARVYLFQTAIDTFYLCYPECKSGNEANAILLHKTLEIIRAFQNKQKLFPEQPQGES